VQNPGGAQQGYNDPGDREGLLTTPSWLTSAGRTPFQTSLHALPDRAANGRAQSYNLAPLIVSAGPDRLLGLDPATFAPLSGDADDNLYPR
jgi:hypothetical protein